MMGVITRDSTHLLVEPKWTSLKTSSSKWQPIYPQDYVSHHGRLKTNTVEGFHGLALLYRDKRTDLGHVHYTCKTNMAICHKVPNTCTYSVLKLLY